MRLTRKELIASLVADGYPDAEAALASLGPFLELAASGKYLLASQTEIDQEVLKSVVTTTTGHAVSKISFVSLADPFPRPDWMTKRAYQEMMFEPIVNCGIRRSIGWNFADLLKKVQREKIMIQLGDEIGDCIRLIMFSDYIENEGVIKVALDSCRTKVNSLNNMSLITDNLRDVLRESIENGIFFTLYYHFFFTLTGNLEAAAELQPLVDLYRQCWVVGFKEDERETLVVVCA